MLRDVTSRAAAAAESTHLRWSAGFAASLGAGAALVLVMVAVLPLWNDPVGGEPLTPFVQGFDDAARAGPADVLLVGDSTAIRDVDLDRFGALLGAPRILNLGRELGAPAPVWYAVLKHRVYGNDLRPPLVVVIGTLEHLLTTRLETPAFYLLDEQVDVPDEVLATKSWPVEVAPPWERALGRTRASHDRLVAWFRYGPARALLEGPLAEDRVTAASRRVFGALRTPAAAPMGTLAGLGSSLPVGGDVEGAPDRPEPTFAATPEDSLLPDLARLVQAHGGRLVVVLAPVLFHGAHTTDPQPIDMEDALAALAVQLGIGWLDDRDVIPDRAMFQDPWHLNGYGKETFTGILARQLRAGGDRSVVRPVGPLRRPRFEVTRTGTIPEVVPDRLEHEGVTCRYTATLPAWAFLANDALAVRASRVRSPLLVYEGEVPLESPAFAYDRSLCSGYFQHEGDRVEVRLPNGPQIEPVVRLDPRIPVPVADRLFEPVQRTWVYPGTTLHWAFAEPWPGSDDTFDISIRVLRMSDPGGPPELRVNSRVIPWTGAPDGDAWDARVTLPRPAGTWSIEVASPADGAYAIVEELTFQAGEQRTGIVAPPFRRRLDVVAEGSVTARQDPPRPVPTPAYPGDFGSLWLPAPFFNHAGCSPVRLLHEGEAVPRTRRPAGGRRTTEAAPFGPPQRPYVAVPDGSFDHLGERLHVGLLREEAAAPERAGYTVGLDPDRKCWARVCTGCFDRTWIYPGDQLTIRVPAAARAALKEALMALEVGADWNTAPPDGAVLSVQVVAGGISRLKTQVPVASLRAAPSLPLSPAIQPDERGEVVVTLSTAATTPALLLSAWLAEK